MSPGTGRLYPLTMICEVWRVGALDGLRGPRSRRERRAGRAEEAEDRRRSLSDEELVEEIRQVLKESDFLGEGHRKVRARLRAKGIGVGKNRVLRLMRENGLLAPVRRGKHPRGDRSHSGRITTDVPNELWGTDATRCYTKEDGWCWFFVAVDHCVTDVVGWHVAKKGDRWAALEPIRQGVRTHMDGLRAQDRSGARPTARLGPSVHRPSVPRRAGLARDPLDGLVRRRAGVQRRRGTLHADAEGRVPVPPRLREPRGGQAGDRCVHRTLQPRVAPGAARVSDPGPGPSGAHPEGGMIRPPICPGNRNRYTFLTQETNLRISDADPTIYLAEIAARDPSLLESHWIPMDPALWQIERYLDFLAER